MCIYTVRDLLFLGVDAYIQALIKMSTLSRNKALAWHPPILAKCDALLALFSTRIPLSCRGN